MLYRWHKKLARYFGKGPQYIQIPQANPTAVRIIEGSMNELDYFSSKEAPLPEFTKLLLISPESNTI